MSILYTAICMILLKINIGKLLLSMPIHKNINKNNFGMIFLTLNLGGLMHGCLWVILTTFAPLVRK